MQPWKWPRQFTSHTGDIKYMTSGYLGQIVRGCVLTHPLGVLSQGGYPTPSITPLGCYI